MSDSTGKEKCPFAKRQKLQKVTSKHLLESESSNDSGLESMSDSTGKEKLVMTKDQVKNKLVRKRKTQCDAKPTKKQKLTDPSVSSKDTATIGKQVCTPILGLGDSVRTSGMIFREKCLVNGVTN